MGYSSAVVTFGRVMIRVSVMFVLAVVVGVLGVKGQELSETAKLLKEQVEQGNRKAISEAADTGDVTLIPYLTELTSKIENRSNPNHPAFYAHVALAKLGNDEALRQILEEVDNESPTVQSNAMQKLSMVGGKLAFRKFYELLDDTRPREDTDCLRLFEKHNAKHPENKLLPYCHVAYFSRSATSMYFLRSMVKDPPTRRFSGSKKEIDLWKEWIRKTGYLNN